jgi:hypothetical protein
MTIPAITAHPSTGVNPRSRGPELDPKSATAADVTGIETETPSQVVCGWGDAWAGGNWIILRGNEISRAPTRCEADRCVLPLFPYQPSELGSGRNDAGDRGRIHLSRRLGIYPYTCVLSAVGDTARRWTTAGDNTSMVVSSSCLSSRSGPLLDSATFRHTGRVELVRKMDHVSVGRAREIGWRQVCRAVAARGRRPGNRQGGPWRYPI